MVALIILPVIFQTVVNFRILSIGGQGWLVGQDMAGARYCNNPYLITWYPSVSCILEKNWFEIVAFSGLKIQPKCACSWNLAGEAYSTPIDPLALAVFE